MRDLRIRFGMAGVWLALAACSVMDAKGADGKFGYVATFRSPPGQYPKWEPILEFSSEGDMLSFGDQIIDVSTWQWLGPVIPTDWRYPNVLVPLPVRPQRFLLGTQKGISMWEPFTAESGQKRIATWPPTSSAADNAKPNSFAKRVKLPKSLDDAVMPQRVTLFDASTDGRQVVAMENFRSIRLIVRDLTTGDIVNDCDADRVDRNPGQFLSFAGKDCDRVVRGNVSKVLMWKVKQPFLEKFYEPQGGKFLWLTISRSRQFLLGYQPGLLTVVDLSGSKPASVVQCPSNGVGDALCGKIAYNDRHCYLGHAGGVVRRVELATGRIETVINGGEYLGDVTGLAVSPNGKRLALDNKKEQKVHIYEADGSPLAMATPSKFYPSATGSAWMYKDVATDTNVATYRRASVVGTEILGPFQCHLVKFERNVNNAWEPMGVIWYANTAKGVGRIGTHVLGGDEGKLRAAFARPIVEVPTLNAEQERADGGGVDWVNTDRGSGAVQAPSWKASKEAEKVNLFGAEREVIRVERRDENRRVTVERYAEGVGLFESRQANKKTELVKFRAR